LELCVELCHVLERGLELSGPGRLVGEPPSLADRLHELVLELGDAVERGTMMLMYAVVHEGP
jgi:hypothetical protein